MKNGKIVYSGNNVTGNADDNSTYSFVFVDDNTVEVTRESDGKKWTLVRSDGRNSLPDGNRNSRNSAADEKFFGANLFDEVEIVASGFGHGDSNQGIFGLLPPR